MTQKPTTKPANPNFSSGPTSKRPGWTPQGLNIESLGRSHRASGPKARIQKVIADSRQLLGMPDDYLLGIVPASDTGAFEMAMWTMLGARPVDIFAWESFGEGWVTDLVKQLKIDNCQVYTADYGKLPDLSRAEAAHDTIFTWNGTTSGVRVQDADWISADRTGITFCDATSAVFAMELDWPKLDVVTWSWQKVLGGEAAHGMLALSPRAVERLETWQPAWPLPKIFRLTKSGKLNKEIFNGSTINTPSLLAVEDQLDALEWAHGIGGLDGLLARSKNNLSAVESWVSDTTWVDFLAADPLTRSSTSICLKIVDSWFIEKDETDQRAIIKDMVGKLADECVAYDIEAYRDAPPGLRIWGGGTVETSDIEAMMPWLDWAWYEVRGLNSKGDPR
jgi:phosphoserine aminotransferase